MSLCIFNGQIYYLLSKNNTNIIFFLRINLKCILVVTVESDENILLKKINFLEKGKKFILSLSKSVIKAKDRIRYSVKKAFCQTMKSFVPSSSAPILVCLNQTNLKKTKVRMITPRLSQISHISSPSWLIIEYLPGDMAVVHSIEMFQ